MSPEEPNSPLAAGQPEGRGGRICVATLCNGGITTFEPDGRCVPLPDPVTTKLCSGGADRRDVWVTASGTGKPYRLGRPRPGLQLAYSA
jgi:gluconolactonase